MKSRFRPVLACCLWGGLLLFSPPAGTAPDNSLTGLDPDSGGKTAVRLDHPLTHLIFFAAWCPPCKKEIPVLTDLAARWESEGYRQVWIAVDRRQTLDRLRRFLETNRLPGTVLYDAGGALQNRFHAESLPLHLLLGRNGEPVLSGGSLEQAAAAVEKRLGGS